MNYSRLKLRDNFSVPSGVIAHRSWDGQSLIVHLLIPGFPTPVKLIEEAAQAWAAFEDGQTVCQTNENGVCDVIGGYEAHQQARALGTPQEAPQAPPQRNYEFPVPRVPKLEPEKTVEDEVKAYQEHQGRTGRINLDNVRKRLNGELI